MDERMTYGQLGYDLARFDRRSRVRQTVLEDEVRAVARPKPKTVVRSVSVNPWFVMGFFIFMGITLLIVFSFATLSEISRENEVLAKQLTTAKKEQRVLEANLETRIKLDEISELAADRLGMIKPDRRNMVYIDLSKPEKVEIFQKKSGFDIVSRRLLDAWRDIAEYFR